MKKLIKSFFIYLITASVLISGNGVVLAIHTCLSSDVKNISLFKVKSCCSDKPNHCESNCPDAKEKLSSKCCTSEIIYQKISDPCTTQKSLVVPSIEFVSSPFFSISSLNTAEFDFSHFIPPSVSFSFPVVYRQLLI